MKYIIDTCVLSEIVKPKPHPIVLDWVDAREENELWLSVITLGELHKGISKLPESRRKVALNNWLENDLLDWFADNIFNITILVAKTWGNIMAAAETKGRTLPAIDALIAATGIANNAAVVTRNVKDMRETGVQLINPWED